MTADVPGTLNLASGNGMLPNEPTTRSDVVTLPGEIEALVAAPDRDIARPMVDFLKRQGINVQSVVDADAAFEEAVLHRPNVILIHEDLGPGGGIELCQRLKANTRTHFVPAVLFSTTDSPAVRARAWAAGADAVFTGRADGAEERARLWALLRTQAIYRRQERRQSNQGTAMQSRQRWIASFVHDLQSALGALQANFDYLSHELGDQKSNGRSSEVADCLRDTTLLFSQLARGLRTVLEYERFEGGRFALKPSLIRLSELAADVRRDLGWQASSEGKRLEVRSDTPLDPVVRADRSLLKDAVQNIVAHLLRQPANQVVTLAVLQDGGETVRLEMGGDEDRMTAEQRGAAFEPYAHPGPKAPAGHGLGLPLAKIVVELHGGKLEVEEREDERYAFVVALKAEAVPPELATGG